MTIESHGAPHRAESLHVTKRGISDGLKAVGLFALVLIVAAGAISLLERLGTGGILIVAAGLVAYLILPIVKWMRAYMPTPLALLFTFAGIGVGIAVAVVVVVPPLTTQARSLIVSLPSLLEHLQTAMQDPNNKLLARLPLEIRLYVAGLPTQIAGIFGTYGISFAQHTLNIALSAASLLLSLTIVPILAIYMFFDIDEVQHAFLGLIPQAARPKTIAILNDLNDVVGAFVRGQILDGAIVGLMVMVMLWIMHVPYALLIGVFAGILNLVPYLGAIVGFVPSVLLAFAFNGWENALMVAVLFGLIQQIDGNLILPRIMKANVQLSPLVIIVSIIVMSAFFGVVGTFLAVPVAAMLRVIKLHFAPAPSPLELAAAQEEAKRLTVF